MIDNTVRPATEGTSGDWEREILRMLWTFHIATTDQLTRLVWNTARPTTALQRRARSTLYRLREMGMAWREARRVLPGYRGHRDGPVSGGLYHGITDAGRAWASARMPELRVLHCMTREGYMHEPERRTLAHSTHLTEYCTRMIHYLRDHPLTVGMFFETESTVLGGHLRMDALIRLRLRRRESPSQVQSPLHPHWHVPWLPTLRTPIVPGTLDATFALEIDEGTESLQVLERKALNYQRTFTQGVPGGQMLDAGGNETALPAVHWQKVLCPVDVPGTIEAQATYFPIPVCVMNSEQRLANVWQAWQQGWPNSEVRMTTWELLGQARSVMSAAYLNQDRQWVDLLGNPLVEAQ